METHLFHFPCHYAPVVYSFVSAVGLLLPLYVGILLHPKELLATHCGYFHYEYWPSISTTIGDMMPERQIWRTTLVITFPFRVLSLASLFWVFWTRGSGRLETYKNRSSKPLSLVLMMLLFFDVARWVAAFVWTMVVSAEKTIVHNHAFMWYIFLSVGFQVSCIIVTAKNRRNTAIYSSSHQGLISFWFKVLCFCAQIASAGIFVVLYIRHRRTCKDGSYSAATIFEWSFALLNLLFDSSFCFDVQNEGLWLSSASLRALLEGRRADGCKNDLLLNQLGEAPSERPSLTDKEMSSTDQYSGTPKHASKLVVHSFSIFSPPTDALMWICDVFWAYQYFGGVLACIEHGYYLPMVAMRITWHLIMLLSFSSPMLLCIPPLRKILCGRIPLGHYFSHSSHGSGSSIPVYALFYLIVVFSHFHQLVTRDAKNKIVASGVSPFFLHLGFIVRFLHPTISRDESEEIEESRRICYVLPVGLVFSMIIRVLYISLDPLYTEPFYGGVFGIGFGLFFALTVFRHGTFHRKRDRVSAAAESNLESDTKIENTFSSLVRGYREVSPGLLGLLDGTLLTISMLFVTCANVLPRYVAVEPMPGAIFVILFFLAGLVMSTFVLPIHSQITDGYKRPFLRKLAKVLKMEYFCCGFVGSALVMLYGTRQTNFTYSNKQYGYSDPEVSIKDWKVQENFRGSKHLCFFFGLIMVFFLGVVYPIAMEMTWVQRRYRNLLKGNTEKKVFSQESKPLMPYEIARSLTFMFYVVAFTFVICYCFVPGGFLFRERSRMFILILIGTIILVVGAELAQIRKAKIGLNPVAALSQRSFPKGMLFMAIFFLLLVLSSRAFYAPKQRGYPRGDKEFAVKYQKQILCVHDTIFEIRKKKNLLGDENLNVAEKAKLLAQYNDLKRYWKYQSKTKKCFSNEETDLREKIYSVAEALYSFSGLIWTTHFALSKSNTDSLSRLVAMIKDTEASVVGILESDLLHMQNGNRDLAEYMSYHLGFPYVDNGPTPLDNTFGCALISRYPIIKVKRYVQPSPVGELSCMIHATLDVMGVHVQTYVAHFGNTEHYSDGRLQSQFLGQVVKNNPGPSIWLGYVVSFPGKLEKYQEYSDPVKPGYLRDAAHFIYTKTPWVRLWDRGGYDEPPYDNHPIPLNEFNVLSKVLTAAYLEEGMHVDNSFIFYKGVSQRTFYYNNTQRYSHRHPRFEFLHRYCQYVFYKTGRKEDEPEKFAGELQPYALELFDWWREIEDPVVWELSDTEFQVIQVRFTDNTEK